MCNIVGRYAYRDVPQASSGEVSPAVKVATGGNSENLALHTVTSLKKISFTVAIVTALNFTAVGTILVLIR
jgi:hypothetical protein